MGKVKPVSSLNRHSKGAIKEDIAKIHFYIFFLRYLSFDSKLNYLLWKAFMTKIVQPFCVHLGFKTSLLFLLKRTIMIGVFEPLNPS